MAISSCCFLTCILVSCVKIWKMLHMWIVDISYENIYPQIFKCEIHRIPSLRSEDIHSSFLDGNRIPELKHENLLANSIFLVGNLMKVFQILNRQYSVFPEGKRAQRFLNENWKIPYFMWEKPVTIFWYVKQTLSYFLSKYLPPDFHNSTVHY